jgi:ABC-2 type transport system ATP-binding protein
VLEVKNVSKIYGNQRGVQNIDFSMSRGEIVGFLGPNGAGKTTTMRMITGYLYPTSGEISIDGISLHKQSQAVKRKIGYLPETPPLYPEMSVAAYLKFVAELRDIPYREQKQKVGSIIERLGLSGREKQIIRGLSKGYKQRLGLAQAIIHNPDLVILDEPTSGLDPKQIVEIRDLIREIGTERTVLLSTHILPEVNSLCNRLLIINEGKIVLDGNTNDLTNSVNEGFAVKLTVKGPDAEIVSRLENIAAVRSVEVIKQDQATSQLFVQADDDVRETLFFALAEAGYPILEMSKDSLSLEDVFMKLTQTDEEGENRE